MNSRERVKLAFNHQEPDRVPIDLGGTIVSSITSMAYQRVRDFLGLPREEMKIIDYIQGLPYINEDLLPIFKIDFRMIQVEYVTVQEQSFSEEKGVITISLTGGVLNYVSQRKGVSTSAGISFSGEADVPPENVAAMYGTALEFGKYK